MCVHTITAASPTPPIPTTATASSRPARVTFTTVPLPVCRPHPSGASSLRSSRLRPSPATLTTHLSLTTVWRAKLDWPKKRPPISGAEPEEEEKKTGSPMKLMSKKALQCEGGPVAQTWQAPQCEKERRTGSPGERCVMALPVRTT